jgi:hypothetical protein
MESLRPNEELLLMATVGVDELGEDDMQKLGFQKTVAVSYRYDGEGNVWKREGVAIRDEEFEALVRKENYRVSVHLLEDLRLNSTEQVDSLPDDKTQDRKGKCGSFTRKSHKNKGKDEGKRFRWGREQRFICGTWRYAKCVHCGYEYWVKVPCNREYCPQCGKPNSLYHRRLYLQILGVLLKMWVVGKYVNYMVITCPEDLREKWKDPNEMRKFMRGLRRKLKELGLWPVLYRWHWAGDRGRRWYPHLNLVFPMGYIDKEKLERLRRYLKRKGIEIIHCQYTQSLKKIRHLARYISRPTWNLQNEVSPEAFKFFRKWGVWGKELLGIKGRIKPVMNEQEREEFWLTLGALISSMVQGKRYDWSNEELKGLVVKFLNMVKKDVGDGVEGLEKLVKSGGDIEGKVRVIVDKVFKMKGWPRLEELASFIVLRGRCIGCFQKLKFKWKKAPFITSDHKVYKLGWGVWVVVNKEFEDEEFPF